MPPRLREAPIRLEIGGKVFGIAGLTGASLAWTRERYRPFLSTRRTAVTISIESLARGRRARLGRPRLHWRDGTFRLAIGSYHAEGSVPTKRLRLRLPATLTPLNPSVFRFVTSFLLLQDGAFLLHAAGVVDKGRAWVFCGPSDSGKTTVARLAGPRDVLNDDTVALVRRGERFVACATPFYGEAGPEMAARNISAPVGALFFLSKASGFAHRRLRPAEAIARAYSQVFVPKAHAATAELLLDALANLVRTVACYELFFPPRAELWEYLDGVA